MRALNTQNTTVPTSTWERLTKLLSLEVRRCCKDCNGRWRLILEQESEDIVQDFLLRKLRRPQWVSFIGQCKHSIERGSLPLVIRTDLRSFLFRVLRALRKEPAVAGSALIGEVVDFSFAPSPMRAEEAADRLLRDLIERYELPPDGNRSNNIREIIRLIRQGWTYRKIACELDVCEKTVRNRLRKLSHRS